MKKNAVRVTIVDEDYTVRSELDPEYTREVAAYVDGAIRRVLQAGPMVESHKAAILAALALTDELFQSRKQQQELAGRLRQMSADLARLLPPQKRQSVGA
ncbi:MAG: cell division protein ZapA [Gemmatimonadales bacterium]|jgi:cell division protein ZapA|nr:cell division protein ZapA [Gemmatimonadales bacterium]MDP3773397.1 cell division protein ZapA [Gemmatimonadales bacterium]